VDALTDKSAIRPFILCILWSPSVADRYFQKPEANIPFLKRSLICIYFVLAIKFNVTFALLVQNVLKLEIDCVEEIILNYMLPLTKQRKV